MSIIAFGRTAVAVRCVTVFSALAALWVALPAQAQVQRTMVNLGFEAPVFDPSVGPPGCIRYLTDTAVPGWKTTDPTRGGLNTTACQGGAPIPGTSSTGRPIELWSDSYSSLQGVVRSRAGNNFAELNAFTASRLSQDVCLRQGESVGWSLSHRGRASDTVPDVMELRVGTLPIARMSTSRSASPASITAYQGTGQLDGTTATGWADYSGRFTYTGATATVDVGFEAISAASGDNSIGNFLDNIHIELRPNVEFAQATYQQNESKPGANVPQLRVSGTVPAGGINVPVSIAGGTATLGVDYTTPGNSASFSVFIPAGVYDHNLFPLPISMVNDGTTEPDETIVISTPATTPADAYNLASLESCGGAPKDTTVSTVTDAAAPTARIQLNKALSADRLAASDQFRLSIAGANGTQGTTTGTGSTVGNGSIQVAAATAGTAYTLSEAMAAGSTSTLSAYSASMVCTNATPNSATVLPSGAGTSFSLTPAAGDNISCTLTNTVAGPPGFIDIVKTVTSGQLYSSVGDVATYSYRVTNTGSVPVSNLTVTDNKIPGVYCNRVITLAPGASVTCTGAYAVTQADVDAMLVTNIATAQARDTSGRVAIDTDDAVIRLATPSLALEKTATAPTYATPGQVLTYDYRVTNDGNVDISAITVSDDRIATVNCPATTLAPGASMTCTASYTVTAADLDAGSVTNIATASGTPAAGRLDPVSDRATVTGPAPVATLTLDKTVASGSTYDAVGDTASYNYLVTNTGNVTINALSVLDDRIAMVNCPTTSLGAGLSTTCTATYTITQADLDAGSVTNHASAHGNPARGTLTPPTDNATIDATVAPALTLDKSAVSGAPYDELNDVIGYQYLVTNTGNVTINGLSVSDDRIASVSCPSTTLAPGASMTCAANYTVTQADLDAGSVTNHASAQGSPMRGTLVPATDSVQVDANASPALVLDKTITAGNPYDAIGDVVAYRYVVTNTGNVTIGSLVVGDDKIPVVTCAATTLAPGASTSCTGTYSVTQADLDAGDVVNHATASGTPSGGTLVPATDSERATSSATPALTVAKDAVAGNPYDSVGDVVDYQYVVTNAGQITISAITVSDDKIATVTCPGTTLAGGESMTCTASYTVAQADVDAGSVTNVATVNGVPATGTLQPDTDSERVTATINAAMTMVKTAVAGGPYDSVGDVIDYEYVLTNNGNVTINGIRVVDDRIATVTCPVTSLAPGAGTTCTARYTVTQADLDAGSVTNHATATGSPAQGTLTPATASETVLAAVTPRLTLVKTAVSGAPYDSIGDNVSYSYVVTNAGNVTISAVVVTDDKIATVNCPVTTLAPGASTTCTASYTITQADLDAGSVTNHADATGSPAQGKLTPATASATVDATALPALTLDKTATAGAPYGKVGDIVSYSYVVTNTGNVTITALSVSDDKIATVACRTTTLAPGASITCTADYSITQADLDAGSVTNNAAASGTAASGKLVPATDSVTVSALPRVTYGKSVDAAGPVRTGDVVHYTITTTVDHAPTTGAITLTDTLGRGLALVSVTDAAAYQCSSSGNVLTCVLAAGATPGTYALTYTAQVGVDASGRIENTVTASGTDQPVCAGSCSTSTPVAAPAIAVAKSSNPGSGGQVQIGQTIEYTLTVTVRNSALLEDLVLLDHPSAGQTVGAMPAGCSYDGTSITCTLPAGSTVGQHSFVYTTQVNDSAGATVDNMVTVMANNSAGDIRPASCTSCSTTHPVAASELRVSKIAAVRNVRVGDLVRYTLTVENVGGGALSGGAVVDTPPAGFSYVEGSLQVVDGDNHGNVEGQSPLRFGALDIGVRGKATLTYLMRVGAGVRPGVHTNRAQVFSPQTGVPISNEATAQVELVADPLLDDSLVFGTVFNDCDGDGWQDEGEAGIPGVRIASVEGLLIETDQYGRYHLAAVPGGKWERGRNFVLKVDPSTLPDGAQFTTDNPLLRRITPGVPVRFDWGVKRCSVEHKELELGSVFFAPGSAEVRAKYQPVVAAMAARVNEYRGGEVVIEATGDTQALAFERATAVQQALLALVDADAARQLKVLVRGKVDEPQSLIVGVDEGGALLGTVLFDTDKSVIKPEFVPLLDKVAAALERMGGGAIAIVGHTDVRASVAYNTALGMRRARAVYDALTTRLSPQVRAKVQVEASDDIAAPIDAGATGGRP